MSWAFRKLGAICPDSPDETRPDRGSGRIAPRFTTLGLVVVLAGCGGGGDDDGDTAGPLVHEIAPAVEALEEHLGGHQRYFEINADPHKVTLWVATNDATLAEPFVYADGEIAEPSEPQGATGPTFVADDISFDEDGVLDQVRSDLADSELTQFSIQSPADEVEYVVVVRSQRGGRLDVRVGPDGDVIDVVPEAPTG